MCCKMAEHSVNQRDHDVAIRLYKEALDYTPEDPVTLLALARLYLQVVNTAVHNVYRVKYRDNYQRRNKKK